MVDPISLGSLILGGGSFLSGLFGGRKDKKLSRQVARSQLALAATLLPATKARAGVSVAQSDILRQILSDVPATSPIARLFRSKIEGLQEPFDISKFAVSEEGRQLRSVTDIPFEEAAGRTANILAAQGATRGGRAIREFEGLARGKAQTETELLIDERRRRTLANERMLRNILGLVSGGGAGGGGEAGLIANIFGDVGGAASERAAGTSAAAGAGVGAAAETFFLNQMLKKRFAGAGGGIVSTTVPSSPIDFFGDLSLP